MASGATALREAIFPRQKSNSRRAAATLSLTRRGFFDRDDCAELVRRNACGRRIDDAGHAGRQRGRFLGRRGRDRADLGPAAAEDAARGGGVRFVRVLPLVDVPADASKDAEDDRTEEDEKNGNSSPMAGPGPLTSFFVARAHVAGLPGFARIAFVLFVLLDISSDVAGLAGLDELVRRQDLELVVPNWFAKPMFDV